MFYLYVIRVQLIPEPLPIDCEDREVVGRVAGHHHPLPAQTEGGGRGEVRATLQGSEDKE